MRRFPWLVFFVSALLIATALLGASCRSEPAVPATVAHAATGPADAPPVRPEPPRLREAVTAVGRGGTLAAALERIVPDEATRRLVLPALTEHLDTRRLAAATGLTALRDDDGIVRSLLVRPAPERLLRLDLDPAGPRPAIGARWLELPVHVGLSAFEGTVDRSVAQAFAPNPHGAQLTLDFADVFQWDLDLLVDPRPGDRVRVVYELRRLGTPSHPLPAFDRAPSRAGDVLGPGRILAASYDGERGSARAYWIDGGADGGGYFDADGNPLRKTFLKSPLNYRRISSRFSRARRNPVTRKVVPHHGVDYAAATGTPVVASADGSVVSASWDGPLGRAVRVRHGSEYVTIYGHLSGFARGIRAGARVRQNQVIGFVGATGRATGPHLHYTVLHRGRAIDPLRMDNPAVEPLAPEHRPDLRLAVARWSGLLDRYDDAVLEARLPQPYSRARHQR